MSKKKLVFRVGKRLATGLAALSLGAGCSEETPQRRPNVNTIPSPPAAEEPEDAGAPEVVGESAGDAGPSDGALPEAADGGATINTPPPPIRVNTPPRPVERDREKKKTPPIRVNTPPPGLGDPPDEE